MQLGDFLEVAAFAHEVFHAVAMGDLGDVLVDDGALIEIGRGVVGGGPDELDAAAMGLVVGLGSREGREEAVVDIDDWFWGR